MTNAGSESQEGEMAMTSELGQPRPCVTVIMANYNGERFLPSAIESVQNQTLADLELIICDDASTDKSAQIISGYAAADPRIKLLRNACNAGPAATRNRALDIASGAWIAVMDSDDIMHPARLKTLIANAEKDGAEIVADDLIVFYQDGAKRSHGLLSQAHSRAPFWVDPADFIRSNTFHSKGDGLGYLKPVLRADALRANKGRYDEALSIGEDYDFMLRLLIAGLKYRVYPQQLYFYRKHGASISHRLSSKAALAMLDADRRFRPKLDHAAWEVRSAFSARSKSLETVLAFNALIDALKARDPAGAAAQVLRRPRLLLLLKEPASAWLGRLRTKLRSPVQTNPRLVERATQ